MSTTTQLTAQAIFDEAFPVWRPKRSDAYRKGVFLHLRYRMLETVQYTCPYEPGSAEADAFWSGVSEGWNLLAKYKADCRGDGP